jgi:hypothetical protein
VLQADVRWSDFERAIANLPTTLAELVFRRGTSRQLDVLLAREFLEETGREFKAAGLWSDVSARVALGSGFQFPRKDLGQPCLSGPTRGLYGV